MLSQLLLVLLFTIKQVTAAVPSSTPTVAASSAESSDHQFLIQVTEDQELELSIKCKASLSHLRDSLQEGHEWAKKMSESIRHRAPDIRSGQMADFGNFDACIGISHQQQQQGNEIRFQGKYCLYRQHFNLTDASVKDLMSSKPAGFSAFFKLDTVAGSICLPSLCSDAEIQSVIQKYLSMKGTKIEIRAGCETGDRINDAELGNEESVFQSILIIWILMIFLSTCLASTLDSEFLKCFSVTENTSQILKQDIVINSSGNEYTFLYGYRFIFLLVASVMHIFELQIFWSPLAVINIANYTSDHSWFLKMTAGHFSHSMGSNFVWAGFLGFSGRYNELKKNKKFNLTKAFVNRILRMVPTILGCYLLILSFPRSLVSGPVFRESFSLIRNACLNNYWTELTFTQNLLYPNETGLLPSWIIASDIQLFAASFFLIYAYYKNAALAKIMIACLIPIFWIAQAAYVHVNNYPGYLDFASYDLRSIIDNIGLHISTINYVPSYLVGMIVGIMIHEKVKVSNNPSLRSVLILSFATAYLSTFALPYTWKIRENVTRVEEVAYASMYRSLIAMAIAASVYWHCTVNDWITKLLSARIFVILGRFNFSIYMGHFIFIYLDIFTSRRPIDYDTYSMVIRTSYVLLYGIVFGYVIHLLFEAPFVRLSRWLFIQQQNQKQTRKAFSPIRICDLNNNGNSTRSKED